jgi:vacuolar protein sorting-associated protein VTA1
LENVDRATARKFLAAANFLELLSVFGDLGIDVRSYPIPLQSNKDSRVSSNRIQNREKIKYSKWKATDIAKAFREGRTPVPGPAGGLPEVEDPATQVNQVTREEEKELKKEFEELVSTNPSTTTEIEEQGETQSEPAYPFPQQPTTLPSAPPLPQSDEEEEEEEEQDSSRIQTPSLPNFIDNDDNNNDTSTSDTPTNTTVDPSSSVPPTPSVLPTSHQTSTLPTPSFHPPSQPPAFPSVVFPPPQPQAQFPEPQLPPPATTSHTQRQEIFNGGGTTTTTTTIPPPPRTTIITTTMDPLEISQVQKHAKWAISALNYEDFDTARKELRLALQMLGG